MVDGIILAGGFGTRLKELLPNLPKPMAPVAGKPFLEWQLDYLVNQGLKHCILSVGYKAEAITSSIPRAYGPLELEFCEETEPLGTGGAIGKALEQVRTSHALVFNGDSFLNINLHGFYEQALACKMPIVMAGVYVDNISRYGSLVTRDNRVLGFKEKHGVGKGLINAGLYLINKQWMLNNLPKPIFSFEAFLTEQVSSIHIGVVPVTGAFIDIGIPEDYKLAQSFIPSLFKK